MPRLKWNRELVEAEARKYSTYTEFKNGNRGAFKWAARNGVINEVTAFMYEITDPDELLQRIKGELGSASRDAKVARDMWESDPSPFYEPSDDPEMPQEQIIISKPNKPTEVVYTKQAEPETTIKPLKRISDIFKTNH